MKGVWVGCGFALVGWSGGCTATCEDDGFIMRDASDCAATEVETEGLDATATGGGLLTGGTASDTERRGDDSSDGVDTDDTESHADTDGETGTDGETDSDDETGCENGELDDGELGIDCGGVCDRTCPDGSTCETADDCESARCEDDVCVAQTCEDNELNGSETDVDCGGGACAPCEDAAACLEGTDCSSGTCTDNVCAAAACDDGVQNGSETDIDCGGDNDCARCEDAAQCADLSDCASGRCVDGACAPPLASCAEILADNPDADDAAYRIDPDGPGGIEPFVAQCDMTTDGGGWTGLAPCDAQLLGGTLVGVEPVAVEGVAPQTCWPFAQDAADEAFTYHYTFAFAPGFSEFYLRDYEAQGFGSGPGNSADIGPEAFIQSSWDVANGAAHGDISFGSADEDGPTTSFALEGTDVESLAERVPWPAGTTVYEVPPTTDFRIGFGEQGIQSEGWYPWVGGLIFLR